MGLYHLGVMAGALVIAGPGVSQWVPCWDCLCVKAGVGVG